MDLNLSFRREGSARFHALKSAESQNLSKTLSPEMELWACLLLKEVPFSDCSPRAILVGDSHPVAHFKTKNCYLELNQSLQSFLPTLFVAQTSLALDRGALPGEQTLFSPLFPSLHRKAIASSKCVVSFHLEPILVALANRVPSIFVSGKKNDETELATKIGIPVVVGQEPRKIAAEVEMYFAHYSWKKWDEFYETLKHDFPWVFKMGSSDQNLNEGSDSSEVFSVCSITDSNYLPFFLGFLENVNEASYGNFKCFLLALDSQVPKQIQKLKLANKVEIVGLQDLWTHQELPTIESRPIGFKAFSTKPKLIQFALNKTQGPVFYCDSDVYFFEPAHRLQEIIGNDSVVLFPHLNDDYPCAQLDGLFNAGMVAVAPGAESFLEWWSELCFLECEFNPKRAVVGDQGYLNQVPILFDRVQIYKGHNHNVARWNSRTLNLTLSRNRSEVPTVDGGLQVSTYHAAFCDEQGIYQKKFGWDQLVSFFSPSYRKGSSKVLNENIRFQQKSYWTYLDHFTKFQKLFQRKTFQGLGRKLKFDSPFWFQQKGRRWLNSFVLFNRVLKKFGGMRRPTYKTSASLVQKIDSDRWVESNLKALNSSKLSPSKSKTAA